MRSKKIEIRYSGSIEAERRQVSYIWNELYASNKAIKMFIGIGSAGKTYSPMYRYFYDRVMGDETVPFTYIVDNDETRKLLMEDNGYKMWSRIAEKTEDINFSRILQSEISTSKGSIKLGKRVIGHVLPFSFYMKAKNMNLPTNRIFFDEFIPEQFNFNNINVVEKIQSLLQTLQREDKSSCIMCANPKTLHNPIMIALGVTDIKPDTINYTKDVAIAWVTGNTLPCIDKMNNDSLAGIFGKGTGIKHRLSGTINRNHSIGVPKDFVCNIGAKGAVVGIYTDENKQYVVGYEKPNALVIVSRPSDIMPNSRVNKDTFERLREITARNKLLFADDWLRSKYSKIMLLTLEF